MSVRPDPHPLLDREPTISGKIRALAAAGYSRAEIANLVDRSYQQVRQVLVEDERRRGRKSAALPTGMAEEALPGWDASLPSYRLQSDERGNVTLPAALVRHLNLGPGERVVAMVEKGGAITLVSGRTAMRQAQEILQPYRPKDMLASEALIAERRAEAARENEGG